ncbi:MAG: hypothetical protein WD342_09855 [Verrucomicrobiales bacterium]
MPELLLATEGGQVVAFDPSTDTCASVFAGSDDEAMMGIGAVGGNLFVASLSRIYKLRLHDFGPVGQTEL